jgi:hypothetical protein
MLMLLYFLITKLYCALIALWKPRQISSQMKQYNADMSHCQYMFSKGKQQWSHINILKGSSNQYEYILQLIMKVCITFYAFLNSGEKKVTFGFHYEIPYSLYHIFKQIFLSNLLCWCNVPR